MGSPISLDFEVQPGTAALAPTKPSAVASCPVVLSTRQTGTVSDNTRPLNLHPH